MTYSAVALGLAAAATWGAADFAGGLATRRAPPAQVVFLAHGFSLLLLTATSLLHPALVDLGSILEALLSGIVGGVALMLFYAALALGAMGLSAALAGVLTAVLPVALALRTEGLPAPAQLAGFAVAAAAIALIAYAPPSSESGTKQARALLFSGLAGLGFGLQLILLHAAAAPVVSSRPGPARSGLAALAPVLHALTLSRLGGTAIALAALLGTHATHTQLRRDAPLLSLQESVGLLVALPLPVLAILAGLLDTSGNGLYMLSSLSGRLDVAAVLSSLYPGGTILLAALLLKERATRLQALGMALALAAVGLIAA